MDKDQENESKNSGQTAQNVVDFGSAMTRTAHGTVYTMTIIGQIEGHGYRRLFRRKVHPVQVAGIDRTPHRYGLLRLRQQAFDIQSEFQRLALAGQTAYQTVIPQRSIQRDAAVIVTSVDKTVDPHGGFGYGRCMQRIETRTVGRHPHRQYAQRIVRQKTADRETVADQFGIIKLLFTVEFPLYGRRSRTYRKRRYRIKRSLPHPQRTFQRHLFRNPEPAAWCRAADPSETPVG